MPMNISKAVDKTFENKNLRELASAPVSALQGVTPEDAKHLEQAFQIKTIRELGTNKFFLWAQAIAALADREV